MAAGAARCGSMRTIVNHRAPRRADVATPRGRDAVPLRSRSRTIHEASTVAVASADQTMRRVVCAPERLVASIADASAGVVNAPFRIQAPPVPAVHARHPRRARRAHRDRPQGSFAVKIPGVTAVATWRPSAAPAAQRRTPADRRRRNARERPAGSSTRLRPGPRVTTRPEPAGATRACAPDATLAAPTLADAGMSATERTPTPCQDREK